MAKKPYPKRVEVRSETSDRQLKIDVMAILADQYPKNGEDYAVHLWYKSHGHNPRFYVTEKSFNSDDNETAILVVNGQRWSINIRTCSFVKIADSVK